MSGGNLPKNFCADHRPCFARHTNGLCEILEKSYLNESKPCPFCKPKREYTKGKYYPYFPPKE